MSSVAQEWANGKSAGSWAGSQSREHKVIAKDLTCVVKRLQYRVMLIALQDEQRCQRAILMLFLFPSVPHTVPPDAYSLENENMTWEI